MKKAVAFLFALTTLLLLILTYKTYAVDKICGWKNDNAKSWTCLCIGQKTVLFNDHIGNWTIFNCTGLNLSCSEFALKYFHGNSGEKPSDCGKTTLDFK